MTSSITWLDHDAAAGERSMRMLAFFKEREARDELGIGGIRDSIADQLFPGTSTIQTRLRYMLFLPWLFDQLEARSISAAAFPGAAREAETRLLAALIANEPLEATGIIGREAGSTLKRTPSSVYWAGLGAWGIRRFDGSLQQYMAQADRRRGLRAARRRRDDDEYQDGDPNMRTWHPQVLKLRAPNFPSDAQISLNRSDAEFLLERWRSSHPNSLLTWLALDLVNRPSLPEADRIWSHPSFADFPPTIRGLIGHGERLDVLVRGAAILYNLQLAQLAGRDDFVAQYTTGASEWAERELPKCSGWDLVSFWPCVLGKGHSITRETQAFLAEWLRIALEDGKAVATSPRARLVVRAREQRLKGPRSRFDNRGALKQWGGAAGTMPLTYRWQIANNFLAEWHEGWREH